MDSQHIQRTHQRTLKAAQQRQQTVKKSFLTSEQTRPGKADLRDETLCEKLRYQQQEAHLWTTTKHSSQISHTTSTDRL